MSGSYVRGRILGQGTWGSVYEAEHATTKEKVAIKRIMAKSDGLNFTALREVKYLQELKYGYNGKYILRLVEVFVSGTALHLVLEFCPYDLSTIIYSKSITLKDSHIKSYMKMFLCGLAHCHNNFILHRDLKPSNLLIRSNGELVLGDFGLARSFGSPVPMTSEVVTRWYKAPELLFGANYYGFGVDIWAAGCIFAELFLREPLFPGETDTEQLSFIFNVFGTPTEETWPNASNLPGFIEFETREPQDLSSNHKGPFSTVLMKHPHEFELVCKILMLNPRKRPSADEVLESSYFQISPEPCEPSQLPIPESK